jgi:glycerol-3-phosphate dehydrogenase subunit B
MTDTIVIGAGLAGLSAAIRVAQTGRSVTLLTFGLGGLQLGQGTIDVLGYAGAGSQAGTAAGSAALVDRPFEALPGFVASHPDHPYARLAEDVQASVDWLASLVPELLVPGDGSNHRVPTGLGAMRPTYLVQPSMVWPNPAKVAVVGPRQIKDFYPTLVAANLEQTAGVAARGYDIDLPARPGEVDSSPVAYALALDHPAFLTQFANQISRRLNDEDAVVVPAILGLRSPGVHATLAAALGRPVVEAVLAPPSIPGMRLNEALTGLAKAGRVRIILGSKVTGFTAEADQVTAVILHQAGRDQAYPGRHFIYAGGGFESGSLALDSYGQVSETLFGLPLAGLDHELVGANYWSDQPLFAVGVAVDDQGRPVHPDGTVVWRNLFAVGGLLAGAVRWGEKSGDGIAVASAVRAGDAITAKDKKGHS